MAEQRRMGARGAWVMAIAFFAAGALLLALALGFIGENRASGDTPLWVIAAAGVLFGAAGFVPLSATGQASRRIGQWMGLLAAAGLATVFHWIAFGAGPRHFSGGISAFGLTVGQTHQSELMGRIFFGFFAVILDLMLVVGLWRLSRSFWIATAPPRPAAQGEYEERVGEEREGLGEWREATASKGGKRSGSE
jgi:hypothetical protein